MSLPIDALANPGRYSGRGCSHLTGPGFRVESLGLELVERSVSGPTYTNTYR